MGKFSPWLLRSWLQKVRSRYTRPPRFLIWTHQNFYKGKNGETRSQKLSQPSWLDSRRGLNWPTVWSTDWLTDWLPECLIDWLTDWLIDWVTDWLINWPINWLTGWLTDWSTNQLTDWRMKRPMDGETEKWADGQTDWLTDGNLKQSIKVSIRSLKLIEKKPKGCIYLAPTLMHIYLQQAFRSMFLLKSFSKEFCAITVTAVSNRSYLLP